LGGLLMAAWLSWARLPFRVPVNNGDEILSDTNDGLSKPAAFMPEAKVLLAASALGLSAFTVSMLAARVGNTPAVVFVFAVLAGVLARNIPQRGGWVRLDGRTRGVLSLTMAAIVVAGLVLKVAPVAGAQDKLQRAQRMIDQMAVEPTLLQSQPQLMQDAEALLHDADGQDPDNAPTWEALAWLKLEESWREPIEFNQYSEMAEDFADRAGIQAPQSSGPGLVRSLACLLNNRVGKAEACVREALNLSPGDARVQFYAVAIFALDPASRPTAQKWVEAARAANASSDQIRRLQAAYDWAVAQTTSLDGNRERTLPAYFIPPTPWPPLEGLPGDAANLPGAQ
jgi:hypothetical protein